MKSSKNHTTEITKQQYSTIIRSSLEFIFQRIDTSKIDDELLKITLLPNLKQILKMNGSSSIFKRVVAYTMSITGYSQTSEIKEALRLYVDMEDRVED